MEERAFKDRLHRTEGPPLLGSWIMSAAPSTAEAMGWCGFDFLVVDMEHTPIGISETIAMLRAIAATPAEAVVRLPWNDQVTVKRVLDSGALTLMFPFIQSAEEARLAVSYTRYPPSGVRGVAAVHRGSHYGRIPNYLQTADHNLTVLIQLETPLAIERLGEIAAVPGVDALFIGPGDLSAAMGRIGEVGHADVQAMIALAAKSAHEAGKPIGIVGPNPEMVQRFLGYGYDWVAVASDLGIMTGRAVEWAALIKGQAQSQGTSSVY